MCVVEKAGFEPRTLGTGAERATNCATAPVESAEHAFIQERFEVIVHHLRLALEGGSRGRWDDVG
jgi:hypothetical protein